MNRIEDLAVDIALLSNTSMAQLAEELVRNFPTRAAALTTFLTVYEQEQDLAVRKELGIAEY